MRIINIIRVTNSLLEVENVYLWAMPIAPWDGLCMIWSCVFSLTLEMLFPASFNDIVEGDSFQHVPTIETTMSLVSCHLLFQLYLLWIFFT